MNYNPYAAPQAAPPTEPPSGASGTPQPWEIGEVIGLAWERFKQNWVPAVFGSFISMIIPQSFGSIDDVLLAAHVVEKDSNEYFAVVGAASVVSFLVSLFFQPGLARIYLACARGEQAEIGKLFSGGDVYFKVLGAQILMLLAIMGGVLLLVVPAFILALGFSLTLLYVADARLGPIAAMKESWRATTGHKPTLFGFGIVAGLLAVAGVLACCIGMFATIPLSQIAWAIVYVRLSGRGEATSFSSGGPTPPAWTGGPAGGGYGAPPGGGYGPPPSGGYGPPPPAGGPGGGYGPPPGY